MYNANSIYENLYSFQMSSFNAFLKIYKSYLYVEDIKPL